MGFQLALPLPPTDNDIYIPARRKGGGKVGLRLSDVARAYKLKVAEAIADAALLNPSFCPEEDTEYEIQLVIFFKATHSAGWPKRAKHRFRKIDSHNRIKLVVDAIMDGLGLDDSCLFQQNIVKQCDPEDPRVEVEIRRWQWA